MNEVTLIFKTPDVFDQLYDDGETRERLRNWVKNDETITVKFDIDNMEAKVVQIIELQYHVINYHPFQVLLHRNGNVIAKMDFTSHEDGIEILGKLEARRKDLD